MNIYNNGNVMLTVGDIEKIIAERDALAAQVEIMRPALELAFISVRTCYKQDWAPFKDFTTVEKAIKLAPSHYLAEIRAEAGRAGFIAGANWLYVSQLEFDVIEDHKVDAAKQYAEQIRQGGAK